jgi:hypothetical protein
VTAAAADNVSGLISRAMDGETETRVLQFRAG